MTLVLDTKEVDYLYINDIPMEQAFVDGVLVFDGPNPGDVVQYVLNASGGGVEEIGYRDGIEGDLQPKEFRGEYISTMVDYETPNTFVIQFNSLVDLGQDWFFLVGCLDLGVEYYSADAVYTFDGTRCTWTFPNQMGFYGGFFDMIMYEKELPENVSDFIYLPDRSSNGQSLGYMTGKIGNDIYGDLDPPVYK